MERPSNEPQKPYVVVTDRFDETLAAYERLGFPRVLSARTSGAVFRAGRALVEVRERPTASRTSP